MKFLTEERGGDEGSERRRGEERGGGGSEGGEPGGRGQGGGEGGGGRGQGEGEGGEGVRPQAPPRQREKPSNAVCLPQELEEGSGREREGDGAQSAVFHLPILVLGVWRFLV